MDEEREIAQEDIRTKKSIFSWRKTESERGAVRIRKRKAVCTENQQNLRKGPNSEYG